MLRLIPELPASFTLPTIADVARRSKLISAWARNLKISLDMNSVRARVEEVLRLAEKDAVAAATRLDRVLADIHKAEMDAVHSAEAQRSDRERLSRAAANAAILLENPLEELERMLRGMADIVMAMNFLPHWVQFRMVKSLYDLEFELYELRRRMDVYEFNRGHPDNPPSGGDIPSHILEEIEKGRSLQDR